MDVLRGDHTTFNPEITSERYIQLRDLEVDHEKTRRLSGGSNTVMLIYLKGDGNGVFKPGDGEDPLEIEESRYKLYRREVAAYEVSQALHPDLVPITTIKKVGGREGSVQDFVQDPKTSIWDADMSDPMMRRQLFELALFDYAIWNKDRKTANYFVKEKKIIAIDNGLSFDNWWQYNITSNLEEHVVGKLVPPGVSERYSGFLSDTQRQNKLKNVMASLVPQQAIDAMFARVSTINERLKSGKIRESDLESFMYHPY